MDILDISCHVLTFLPFAHKYMYVSKIFTQAYLTIQKEYIHLFYKGMNQEQQINAAAYVGDLYTILYLADQTDTLFAHALKCLHICGKHRIIAYIVRSKIMENLYNREDIKWIIHYASCLQGLELKVPWTKDHLYEYHTTRMKKLPTKDIVGSIHPAFAWEYYTNSGQMMHLSYGIQNLIKNLAGIPFDDFLWGSPYRYISDDIKVQHMEKIIQSPHIRLFDASLESQKIKVDEKLKAIRACKIVSPSVICTIQGIRNLNVLDEYPYRIRDFNPTIQMIFGYYV